MASDWERTGYRKGRTVVSLLRVHLAFVTKYRRKLLSERAIEVIQEACLGVCNDFAAKLVELDGEDDHVHIHVQMLIEYRATIGLSPPVNSLKGVSSRMLRTKNFPEVQRKLWSGHIRSPRYFAVSFSGAPIEVVKKYIEEQRR